GVAPKSRSYDFSCCGGSFNVIRNLSCPLCPFIAFGVKDKFGFHIPLKIPDMISSPCFKIPEPVRPKILSSLVSFSHIPAEVSHLMICSTDICPEIQFVFPIILGFQTNACIEIGRKQLRIKGLKMNKQLIYFVGRVIK